jgi:hypothetical protein
MKSKSTITKSQQSKPSKNVWTPSTLHLRAVKHLISRSAAGLFLDPGAGKTSITLAAFKLLKKKRLAKGMLVVAPRRPVRMVWSGEKGEPTKWEDFKHLSVGRLHGSKKDEVVHEKHDIYVMTPDGLEWLLFGREAVAQKKLPPGLRSLANKPATAPWKTLRDKVDVLCLDELRKYANTHSLRHRLMRKFAHHFKRRWGLTGSPAAKSLLDLYGQCYLLDGGKALGPYFSHYRETYFDKEEGPYGAWKLHDDKAEAKIYSRLKGLVLRLELGDYVKMPRRIDNPIYVELPEAAREVYDELEAEMFTMIDQNVVSAYNAGGVAIKCKQMANGSVYVQTEAGKPRKVAHVHAEKAEALAELVDELQGAPLLVGVEYHHDVDAIRRVLGKDIPYIGGGMSDKEADRVVEAWNDGELSVLLGHPASMGHGLNMQGAAQHVALYSIPYDYDLYDQFIRRVQRQGNKFLSVFVHHFIARDTVDEDAMRGLARKAKTQNALFAAMAKYAQQRRRNRAP